ncbi:hypothetical protein RB195_019747 [Necator americanus]|uniref:Uncharacterized protein n=1 Tax=Necator americanus TaxID=51031 RepID=A0ABR1CH68_NECAM
MLPKDTSGFHDGMHDWRCNRSAYRGLFRTSNGVAGKRATYSDRQDSGTIRRFFWNLYVGCTGPSVLIYYLGCLKLRYFYCITHI